jgi:hypothetical protein
MKMDKSLTLYRHKIGLYALVFLLLVANKAYSQPEAAPSENAYLVTYTGTDSPEGEDSRNLYFIELLKQALAHANKGYTVKMSVRGASHARQMKLVVDGKINVMWDAPGPEMSEELMPIEIPIDKGLIGWRLFFIKKEDQRLFSKSTTLEDLKKMRLGQVKSWHDTSILKENQLNVVATPNYISTFKMLASNRFTYFPRSVSEIWQEQEERQDLLDNIVIEKNLVLHYPIAYFYYVNKRNHLLAKDLQNGLEKMLADGSFDRLFNEYNSKQIALAEFHKRKVIHINNPFLPVGTYNKYKNFWFDPKDYSPENP